MSLNSDLFNQPDNVLISDQFNNRVIETNPRGEIVWSFGLGPNNFTQSSIIGVHDAQRVGKNTLMAGTGIPAGLIPEAPMGVIDNRVILVDKLGNIIWQYGQFGLSGTGTNLLNAPVQCTFIPCSKIHNHYPLYGSVLITDRGNNRVIEVNSCRKIIWQYPGPNMIPSDQLSNPNSAQKLCNGHYLIADKSHNRAIEVNKHHIVTKVFTANGTLGECTFASRLHNGNTLLTDSSNNRVVEVDSNDNVVWQYITNSEYFSIPLPSPNRSLRLKNGDTLISDQYNNRVIRVNHLTTIMGYYGLPIIGGMGPIGPNKGYDVMTTQLGLYSPCDAKIIGDYTGITNPDSKKH